MSQALGFPWWDAKEATRLTGSLKVCLVHIWEVWSQVIFSLHSTTSFSFLPNILHIPKGLEDLQILQVGPGFEWIPCIENEPETLVCGSHLSVRYWEEQARSPKLVDTHGPRDGRLSQLHRSVSWSSEKWETYFTEYCSTVSSSFSLLLSFRLFSQSHLHKKAVYSKIFSRLILSIQKMDGSFLLKGKVVLTDFIWRLLLYSQPQHYVPVQIFFL